MKLTELKGIGPKTEELFAKLGVFSTKDLIRYYPISYDAYDSPRAIGSLYAGMRAAVEGIIAKNVVVRNVKRLTIVTTEISDPGGRLVLTWFNAPFVASLLKKGSRLIFRGSVREKNGRLYMDHPEIFTPEKYGAVENTLVPVYGLTKGLSGKTVTKAVRAALEADSSLLNEYLPETSMHLLGLADEAEAIRNIHFPKTAEDFQKARERLAFDELFLFIMAVRTLKARDEEQPNYWPMKKCWETEELTDALPFELTGAQKRVWREIEADLSGHKPMSRLIQGDVGSGKTILAFFAMLMCAVNGYQSALMAPTEVLAKQHYEKLCALKEKPGTEKLAPVLLTGSMKAKEKREALQKISSGEANTVIGTHALFQEAVVYKNLALVITDEQHRFGVRQRQAMTEKCDPPHTMVMSATPIPRTLGVIFYGDLDISLVDELPKTRLPIKNAVVDNTFRQKAMRFFAGQLKEGRQIYVICPMIEENESIEAANVTDTAAALRKEFPGVEVGKLHGRMKAEEKDRIMEKFLNGTIRILVSTTVVEVGVDVPNATVMMIENAERFGLAQLHQLRGRVGRGSFQSYCIFMAGEQSEQAKKRLEILRTSDNGFEIAEKDFALRGPGDLLGIRQSGDAMFRIADLTRDAEILKTAGAYAASVMHDDPALIFSEHELLRAEMERYIESYEKTITI